MDTADIVLAEWQAGCYFMTPWCPVSNDGSRRASTCIFGNWTVGHRLFSAWESAWYILFVSLKGIFA